jgi:hypothetical protein
VEVVVELERLVRSACESLVDYVGLEMQPPNVYVKSLSSKQLTELSKIAAIDMDGASILKQMVSARSAPDGGDQATREQGPFVVMKMVDDVVVELGGKPRAHFRRQGRKRVNEERIWLLL